MTFTYDVAVAIDPSEIGGELAAMTLHVIAANKEDSIEKAKKILLLLTKVDAEDE